MDPNKNTEDEKLLEFLKANSPFVDKNISHEDFSTGIKNGSLTIEYDIKDVDVYAVCSRKRKNSLGLIHIICFLLPFLLVILFSIVYSNWWLLIGILISYIAIILTHHVGYKPSVYVLLLTIGSWFARGFHFQDYFTFFPLTFVFSQMITSIEKEYDDTYLKEELVESPILFYELLDKITIIRKLK